MYRHMPRLLWSAAFAVVLTALVYIVLFGIFMQPSIHGVMPNAELCRCFQNACLVCDYLICNLIPIIRLWYTLPSGVAFFLMLSVVRCSMASPTKSYYIALNILAPSLKRHYVMNLKPVCRSAICTSIVYFQFSAPHHPVAFCDKFLIPCSRHRAIRHSFLPLHTHG